MNPVQNRSKSMSIYSAGSLEVPGGEGEEEVVVVEEEGQRCYLLGLFFQICLVEAARVA